MNISFLATPDFVRRVERLATTSAPGQTMELGGVQVQYVADESRRQLELRDSLQLLYHNNRLQEFGVLGARFLPTAWLLESFAALQLL